MSEEQKELKKEILKALIDKEWTATDLADLMGISRTYMNDLINGRRISHKRMEQIKKILGIT
nr:MAG TPA: helix-turn-helix domain protein [Caudoviricetes sp.]